MNMKSLKKMKVKIPKKKIRIPLPKQRGKVIASKKIYVRKKIKIDVN